MLVLHPASQKGLSQLSVTFLEDHLFQSQRIVGGSDVSDRGVQSV